MVEIYGFEIVDASGSIEEVFEEFAPACRPRIERSLNVRVV